MLMEITWLKAASNKPKLDMRVIVAGHRGIEMVFAKWNGANFVESSYPDGSRDGPILSNVHWWALVPPIPLSVVNT